MSFIQGIIYNFKGLLFSLRRPKLLFWGLLRFCVMLLITLISASLILMHHQDILAALWEKPASIWIVWLWHLTSWLLSLFLVGVSSLISYFISQILFSVVIMDYMSRTTEKMVRGEITAGPGTPVFKTFTYLISQEIPRTIVPVMLSLLLMVFGWLTPLGPVAVVLSSALTAIFLAWDNTDLIPARQMIPFKARFRRLCSALPFHLGFGLPLLIPLLNILLLSFAPVGAALHEVEQRERARDMP